MVSVEFLIPVKLIVASKNNDLMREVGKIRSKTEKLKWEIGHELLSKK